MDWRTRYTICEHVANLDAQGERHRGFRVCCEACYSAGFLDREDLETVEHAEYDVRRIANADR